MEKIGPYALVRELGRGGMGAVFQARDARGVDVAVKVLAAASEAQRERLRREGKALLRLRHPNIVTVLDVGEDRGRPFVAMELVEGLTLEARLRRQGRLDPEEAVALAYRLALALEHAHSRGVLHRDVKPSNVLIHAQTEEPLLTDFGLARTTDLGQTRLTQSGVILGTPGFAAPELLTGDAARVGPATDVYGLGATLYAALTGSPPIEGSDLIEVVVATQERRPETPSSKSGVTLPQALEDMCMRCLEKDPAARYPSAAELARDLDAYVRGDARPRRRGSGPPAAVLALMASAVVAVAVVMGVVLIVYDRRQRRLTTPDPVTEAPPSPPPTEPPPAPPAPPAPPTEVAPAPAPDHAAELEELLARSRQAILRGDHRQGLALADTAVDLAPRDARAWSQRAQAHLAKNDLEAALADAERAVSLDPGLVEAYVERGTALGRLRDHAGAARDMERAVSLDPGDHLAWMNLASACMGTGDAPRALEAAERCVRIAPAFAYGHVTLGLVLARVGRFEEARAALDEGLRLDADIGTAYVTRGMVRARLGDLQGTVDDSTRAIELEPTNVKAWTNRANAHMSLGRLDLAIADCTRALEVDPRAWTALFNRGVARRKQGDLDAAEQDFTRAIEVDPAQGIAFHQRSLARLARGDAAAALADSERALQLVAPEDPTRAAISAQREAAARALSR